MNISETNAIESVKNSKEMVIKRNQAVKKYNRGVNFRNFLRKRR